MSRLPSHDLLILAVNLSDVNTTGRLTSTLGNQSLRFLAASFNISSVGVFGCAGSARRPGLGRRNGSSANENCATVRRLFHNTLTDYCRRNYNSE
jgi:hypothetical protein